MNKGIFFIDLHTHQPAKVGVVSLQNISLADIHNYPNEKGQFFSVGLHPWQVNSNEDLGLLNQQLRFAAGYQHVKAIGETGIDKSIELPLEYQEAVFKVHIRVSEEFQLPLVVHCVRAFQEILVLRKSMAASQPWIFHGFAGSAQLARQCLNAGCLLSFGPSLLNDHSRSAHSMISLGIDDFFLETDDSGIDVEVLYRRAAHIKHIGVEVISERILNRFNKIFCQQKYL